MRVCGPVLCVLSIGVAGCGAKNGLETELGQASSPICAAGETASLVASGSGNDVVELSLYKDSVYLLRNGAGTLERVDPRTGEAETLATGLRKPRVLAVDGSGAYFAEEDVVVIDDAYSLPRGWVSRISPEANSASEITESYGVTDIELDERFVYVGTGFSGLGSVSRFDVESLDRTSWSAWPTDVRGLTLGKDRAYWSSTNGRVYSKPFAAKELGDYGKPVSNLDHAAGSDVFAELDADLGTGLLYVRGTLFVIDHAAAAILRVSATGSSEIVANATPGNEIGAIASDDQFVYFTDAGPAGSRIRRVPANGGALETRAELASPPTELAVDSSCVFWTDPTGALLRSGK